MNDVKVRDNIVFSENNPFVLMSGPCVLEENDSALQVCESLKKTCEDLKIPYIFKASFDKANRTSLTSFRGPGLEEGLKRLQKIKTDFDVPIVTDIHEASQAKAIAEVADIIQIPAFLCRQTDLLVASAKTGKIINIKKGQFLAPEAMEQAVNKVKESGNDQILLTERGTTFGYGNLIVDFRGFPVMKNMGTPLVFDATHSVQKPGGLGASSGGDRTMVPHLVRAALALKIQGLFLEVHPDPDNAGSDGPNSIKLTDMAELLKEFKDLDDFIKGN